MYLDFKGNESNEAEQMYVTLQGASDSGTVLYDGDANDLQRGNWKTWRIDLQDFGFELDDVRQIIIGFSNELDGAGIIYFDKIRLYTSRCLDRPNTDLNGDCVVDFGDYSLLVGDWYLR